MKFIPYIKLLILMTYGYELPSCGGNLDGFENCIGAKFESPQLYHQVSKTCPANGGFKSEDTGRFLLLQKNIPNLYPEQKI
jgi:hypothetical protein